MSERNINLLWKEFKGIRKLHSINSDKVLGADIAHNIRLSKEKSGEARSIRSSGWYSDFTELEENVIRLFSANISGYGPSDQLIAFTKTNSAINVWVIYDNTGNAIQTKIATFPNATDVTDVCMIQWGDRYGMAVAFGLEFFGFVFYSADVNIPNATQMGNTNWYYIKVEPSQQVSALPLSRISRVCPYGSRLAINGEAQYSTGSGRESIFGVWFGEAGNLTNFTADPITSATETSSFYVETGEYVNQLEEYHGLTAFCRNRSYNITGSSQNDIRVLPLTAKGVFGNATYVINGKCGYVDAWSKNIFTLRDNIDGTIGFDDPVGDDIQDYIEENISDVTINIAGRKVRITQPSGVSLLYDVDIGEWVEETFPENARIETFLNSEYICDKTNTVYVINENWGTNTFQMPDENGYYSHYRTNLIWLDSQSSVKSHLYPFAIILEPNTSNNFRIKFTTDRGESIDLPITKAGFENAATYSNDDNPNNGSYFVLSDDDTSGKVFFSQTETELLVTVERPPFWRYLQIDIYTNSHNQQFNISGIEAKNTMLTDEMLEY